jgi:hypothetical protein
VKSVGKAADFAEGFAIVCAKDPCLLTILKSLLAELANMIRFARSLLPAFLAVVHVPLFAAIYYVSFSAGSDTNPGTSLGLPFKTITRAVSVSVAGDIIYLRGETHTYNTKISISKSGSAAARIQLLAYPGDAARPQLNFSGMAVSSSNRGMELSGSYWTIKGIDFFKAGDNGMHLSGAFNIIEFCSFFENADTGLQLSNGANNNQVINCDSYNNIDPSEGNADGFAAKLDVGTGNAFRGCRAWQNSDDGWDGLLTTGLGTNPATTYDSCWCFRNGYRKDGTASTGNGNGFKMGGNQERHDATLRNCLAVYNRVKGFDQNNNKGSMILYNCTGYWNGQNYGMSSTTLAAGEVMVLANNISYINRTSNNSFTAAAVFTTNSWQSPFVVDAADFVSLDTALLRAPRNADGSLPNINLLALAPGSDMIDAGTNVGIPFAGAGPDLGYRESDVALPAGLLQFGGRSTHAGVALYWRTSAETNNKGWEVERLAAGATTWQRIGFVPGKGSSSLPADYAFDDNSPLKDGAVQYRLRQIDTDGRARYSQVLWIKAQNNSHAQLALYPNPAKDQLTLRIVLPQAGQASYAVCDANGRPVLRGIAEKMQQGATTKSINIAALPAGAYYVQLMYNGKTSAWVPVQKL